MASSSVTMPDGTPFDFWDDTTDYTHIYHVACGHPTASDDGPGAEDQPFATIGRAARLLQPGEKVIVHDGIYRECVCPARGGEAPDRMIAYEAAAGEKVVVRGSEPWTPAFTPGDDQNFGRLPGGTSVWVGEMPEEWFIGYNPFMTRNFSSEYTTFTNDWTNEEILVFLRRRGMVFVDGKPLKQVFRARELGKTPGAFWVEDPGLRLYVRLWDDGDPNGVPFEVTTREQVFAPHEHGLGYIRVSGFTFEHAADGIPVPQRAMVSAARGHHWIIEGNEVRQANACGIDVGNETWHRPRTPSEPSGRHLIRRNRVSHCGICGIAAVGNNTGSLVEDNIVEYIGHKNIERIWETGGLKFHTCDTVLIRNNVFRHISNAPGLWLDFLNRNCRVTGNVFADIEAIHGGVYMEVSHALNVVDHNILWDIRGAKPGTGHAVDVDTGELCVVAHNLIGRVRDGYGVAAHLGQKERIVGGRVGLGRRHTVANNIFCGCPRRILFSRSEENRSDGNLFDVREDAISFCVEYPAPQAPVDLAAWQAYFGFDANSLQARIEVDFDPETLTLTLDIDGEMPQCMNVEALHDHGMERSPGPVEILRDRREYRVGPTR